MSYQKPYDPMAKILIAVASVVLLGAIAVLLNNLFTTIQRNSSVVNIVNASSTTEIAVQQDVKSVTKTTEKEEKKQENTSDKAADTVEVEQPISQLASAISDNIRPIGSADASAKSASSTARSGEEIFNGVCTACHTTGVLEAPKLDDKAAWEPRMANGFDALVASGIKGKGNMPAKGGDISLSDDEVKTTIIYMLEKAGIDTGVSASATETPAPAVTAPTTEAPAPAVIAPTTEAPAPAAIAPTTEAPAPAAIAPTTEAPAPAAIAPTTEAPVPAAIAPTTEAPAPAVIAPTTEAPAPAVEIPVTTEVPTIPATPTAPTTPETPATPTTPEIPTTPAAPSVDQPINTSDATTANVPTATVAIAPAIADNSVEAKKLYKTLCFTCHDAGVAGAPIIGNKEQWAPRIAQGKEALYHTSLNGKGAMPPKGGNTSLDDNLVKSTVDYMIELSK